MFDKVKEILAKELRISPDKITAESDIKADLGADSIHILQLLMTLEEDYGIVIPDEKLADFVTVSDIVDYLDKIQK